MNRSCGFGFFVRWDLFCSFFFSFLNVRSFFQGMKGKIDEYSDSDDDQHDAYLERMKAEGKIREEGNDSDESDGGSGEWPSHHDPCKRHMLT